MNEDAYSAIRSRFRIRPDRHFRVSRRAALTTETRRHLVVARVSTTFTHEEAMSSVARTLIRSDSRPLSSVITRACEGSAMYAS